MHREKKGEGAENVPKLHIMSIYNPMCLSMTEYIYRSTIIVTCIVPNALKSRTRDKITVGVDDERVGW